MKIRGYLLLSVLLCLCILGGCKMPEVLGTEEAKEDKAEEGTYSVYYMNMDETGLEKDSVEAEGNNTEETVAKLLDLMDNEKQKQQTDKLKIEITIFS